MGPINQRSVYGVMGDPIGHSMSPAMHNRGFAETGINGVYVAFQVPAPALQGAITGIRSLGIEGVSVTIPHKVAVMALLDDIDEMAVKIGAVNTIVNRGGTLFGCNTDCSGAMAALAEKTTVKGKDVWIVGAGGAARAVGFGVVSQGGNLSIVNRSRERGTRLAADLGADFKPLGALDRLGCDILINTTSVGMSPGADAMPIDPSGLEKGMVVMDIVYNPLKTRLLETAEKKRCVTVDGVAMFVNQGALQFELWTGAKAPVDAMRKTVLDALGMKA